MCQPGGLTTPRPLLKWPLQQSHAAARDITPDPFHMLPAAGRERRQPCPHGGSPPRPKTATPRCKWGKRLCAHSPFSNAHGQFAPQNPGGELGRPRTSPSRQAAILQHAQTKKSGAQHHPTARHRRIRPRHRSAPHRQTHTPGCARAFQKPMENVQIGKEEKTLSLGFATNACATADVSQP